jgi:lycopene cyclase domain-containing protein
VTYLTFHLVFLLPPLLALAAVQSHPPAGRGGPRARWGLPLICLIAFAYTTPWDNFLVHQGVWSYGPERVWATIGYVPVEEYAFFILQTLLTGLLLYWLLARKEARTRAANAHDEPARPFTHPVARYVGTGIFLMLSLLGAALLGSGWARGRYAGLILAWAGPVLTLLWAFGGNVAWALRGVFAPAVLVPTIYLWGADAVALRLGIWHITRGTSLGVGLLGLPVEEAAFFLMTNLMVVLGLLLLLFSERAAGRRLVQRIPDLSSSPPEHT